MGTAGHYMREMDPIGLKFVFCNAVGQQVVADHVLTAEFFTHVLQPQGLLSKFLLFQASVDLPHQPPC